MIYKVMLWLQKTRNFSKKQVLKLLFDSTTSGFSSIMEFNTLPNNQQAFQIYKILKHLARRLP